MYTVRWFLLQPVRGEKEKGRWQIDETIFDLTLPVCRYIDSKMQEEKRHFIVEQANPSCLVCKRLYFFHEWSSDTSKNLYHMAANNNRGIKIYWNNRTEQLSLEKRTTNWMINGSFFSVCRLFILFPFILSLIYFFYHWHSFDSSRKKDEVSLCSTMMPIIDSSPAHHHHHGHGHQTFYHQQPIAEPTGKTQLTLILPDGVPSTLTVDTKYE